jgi:2-dehydropantoate 2-reductase
MRKHGLRVTHAIDVPEFCVAVRALHVTDAQQLAKEKPVDITCSSPIHGTLRSSD